jgi:formate dehydrogenase accessory protein FdhD
VDEAPVWISINGMRHTVVTCTPSETDALAAGHLIGSGCIASAAEILEMSTVAGPGGSCGVELRLDGDRADAIVALQRHLTLHGCGVRHLLDCEGGRGMLPARHGEGPIPSAEALASAMRTLFAAADRASPEGGVHAAAMMDAGGLHHATVDVARHCAADRAIGLAALAGDDLRRLGMLTTSRISGAIALKAAFAGVAWLASRSIATPLAREIARHAGLPLLERAARRKEGR